MPMSIVVVTSKMPGVVSMNSYGVVGGSSHWFMLPRRYNDGGAQDAMPVADAMLIVGGMAFESTVKV